MAKGPVVLIKKYSEKNAREEDDRLSLRKLAPVACGRHRAGHTQNIESKHSFACRWNKYLGKFLTSLCKHLNKRLAKEANTQDEGDEGEDTKMQAAPNGHAAAQPGRRQLSTDLQRRLATVILRMADKAQYSKVSGTTCIL